MEGLAKTEEQAHQFRASMVANIPMGRLGIPDEVAKASCFSPPMTAALSTGPNSFVDGGLAQI